MGAERNACPQPKAEVRQELREQVERERRERIERNACSQSEREARQRSERAACKLAECDVLASRTQPCANGCGRVVAQGFSTCCRTCGKSGGRQHGQLCELA